MNGWIRIPKQSAKYCGISVRTFEDWLRAGLRYSKVGACRLTRAEWIDSFIENHEAGNGNQVDKIVNDVLRGI